MEAKDSEMCLRVRLKRDDNGLTLNIKTSSLLEGFMKSLGPGTQGRVSGHGKLWVPMPGQPDLLFWEAPSNALQQLSTNRYRLDYLGRSLDLGGDFYPGSVNLSFLRLCGVSEPDGITFQLKDQVYSLEALRELKDNIVKMSKLLYVDFIRPVDLCGWVTQTSHKEVIG